MEKVLAEGKSGSAKVIQENGELKLQVEMHAEFGGVMKGKSVNEIDLDEKAVIELGFELFKAQFPAFASLINEAEGYAKAEIAKV